MSIITFDVEKWLNKWESRSEINLGETCISPLSVAELAQMTGLSGRLEEELAHTRLTYGAIPGTTRFRRAVAKLYDYQTASNVLSTHGAISASALVYQSLIKPNDHVITFFPDFCQHYHYPEAVEADMSQLVLRPEEGYVPDLDKLASMMRDNTKMIAFTNPSNPIGAVIAPDVLQKIVEIANRHDAWILCDEIYRGTEQSGQLSPSIADMYDKGISVGSVSKVFSAAGLRVGWVVAAHEHLQMFAEYRDYTTISVGILNDFLATTLLENAEEFARRSHSVVRQNLALLDAWVTATPGVEYMHRPEGGTMAMLHYELDIPSYDLCQRLIEDTGVMLVPGAAVELENSVRIGFGCAPELFERALKRLSKWFANAET